MTATSLVMKYQLILQVFYFISTLFLLYWRWLPLWKFNFYMSAFDWLRMSNKYGFQLANRFARTEFFNLFITKDSGVRTDEFAAIVILLPSKPLVLENSSHKYIFTLLISLVWVQPFCFLTDVTLFLLSFTSFLCTCLW